MKNLFYRLYAGAFIGICLIPAVLTPFIKNDSSKEKRELADFPSIKTEDGSINFDFFSEFETYFSEHFAFRQQLVNADGRVRAAVTATSSDEDVIVGRNGWLYYAETIPDYLRTETLSESEISSIANNLRIMNTYCENSGAEFIFFSAPNKNTMYPENMPFNYVPSDNASNLEQLTEKLKSEDFYFDMKSALLGLESPTPLYHKTDTHWNNFGAYAAHTMLMNKFGRPSCPSGTGWYTANDRLGDLAAMVYPAEKPKDMQLHNDYEFTYEYTSRFRGLDDIEIDTECEGKDGKLLMFRDSYGEAILPYMAESFGEAEFSRAVPYNLKNVSEGDFVIIELVERNLKNLLKYMPVMEAPRCDISVSVTEKADSSRAYAETSEAGNLFHISGNLPEECFSGTSHRIFVVADGECYEAFAGFDDTITDSEKAPYVFSAYLPSDKNNSTFKVIVLNSDSRAVSVEFE